MGDLIEGIGDEVLLFVSFLSISMAFLFYVSFLRGERAPVQPQESQHPPTTPPAQPHGETAPSQDQARETTGPQDGLRHRPHANAPPNESEPASENTQRSERGRGTTTTTTPITADTGSGEITVKLVQAGGPERTQEVLVTPDTTLEYLRR